MHGMARSCSAMRSSLVSVSLWISWEIGLRFSSACGKLSLCGRNRFCSTGNSSSASSPWRWVCPPGTHHSTLVKLFCLYRLVRGDGNSHPSPNPDSTTYLAWCLNQPILSSSTETMFCVLCSQGLQRGLQPLLVYLGQCQCQVGKKTDGDALWDAFRLLLASGSMWILWLGCLKVTTQ